MNRSGGRWDPSKLDPLYAYQARLPQIARADVEHIARLLTAPISSLRSMGRSYDEREGRDPSLVKHPVNPLIDYPLVALGEREIWAPVGPLVWRAFLPQGIYVRGRGRWRDKFTETLGLRVEQYVGALTQNAATTLFGEIKYGREGGKKSVDWIWISSKAVLLIECKSAGLGIDAQAGGGRFSRIVDRTILEGRRQIDRTAELIRAGADGFEQVPRDRPIFGLVVTSDFFPMANAGLAKFGQPGVTPSLLASVRSFEHLTSRKDAMEILIGVFEDKERRRWDLGRALREFPAKKHSVSEQAWQRLRFQRV